jgi:hypothetical protein
MINLTAPSLLLAGCVVFGTTIFLELAPGGGQDQTLPEAALRANVAPAVHRQQTSRVDGLLETALARPLFSSTRRPPQSATDGDAADTDLSDKRLTGIVTAPGHHLAIFAVTDAKPLTLTEGETVSGWRIETIGPIEVSLSGPGGNKTLRPKPDPTLAQPPETMPLVRGGAQPPSRRSAAMLPKPAAPPNVPGPPPRPPRVGPRS